MKPTHLLILLVGLSGAAGFVTGVQRAQWTSSGGWVYRYYDGWERFLALGVAIFCFSWVLSLRRRQTWGWYVGCAFLLLIILQFVWQGIAVFISQPTTLLGWWALFSQSICAFLAGLVLRRWWWPKKHEFTKPPSLAKSAPDL